MKFRFIKNITVYNYSYFSSEILRSARLLPLDNKTRTIKSGCEHEQNRVLSYVGLQIHSVKES